MQTASYPSPDGGCYDFEVHPIGTPLKPVPGIYAFIKPRPNGNWDVVYVGETGNLNERLNTALQTHQAWPRCCTYGATHLAVLVVNGGVQRLTIETYLRHATKPPANEQ